MNNTIINKQNVIFVNHPKNTIRIWEAEYEEEKCYAIEHIKTGHIELIDKNQSICTSITEFITSGGTLILQYVKGRRMFHLKHKNSKKSLRMYVYTMYKGIEPRNMSRKKINLCDRTLIEHDILDLRSGNLYLAGDFLPVKNGIEIMPLARDGGDPEYLMIRMQRFDAVEFVDYSQELYEMLASSELCCLAYSKNSQRMLVNVNSSEPKTVNLSRFVMIYELEFNKYKDSDDPIRQFIFDFLRLNSKISDEADHVNAHKFISCTGNLLLVKGALNDSKSDNIRNFCSGGVEIDTVVTPEQEVLIAYQLLNGSRSYYKCQTPEDLADWQKVFLGRGKPTQNTKVIVNKSGAWVYLKEIFKRRKRPKLTCEEKTEVFWNWVDKKNELLSMHSSNPEQFKRYPNVMVMKAIPCPDEVGQSAACVLPELNIMGKTFKNVPVLVTKISEGPSREE